MASSLSRRTFVRAGAALAGAAVVRPDELFAFTPFVRRNVGNLDASNPIIASYKTAIANMQARPASDPLSWAYQAAIHGTVITPALTAWNTCAHGNYFFFSWHRMYLWYFERIVRRLSGDPTWALPFWDWENPSQRVLPSMFRTPSTANPLFVANRGPGWNAGSSSLGAGAVNTSFAMAEIPFNSFSSSLESPHGSIHVSIGGWMSSIATAAQDPIFWLHHGNVDRYWNLWLAQGGGRTMPLGSSAADVAWKNTQFTFFDEYGHEVKLTGCHVLRAQEQLDYVYECEPTQVRRYCRRIVVPPRWIKDIILRFPLDRVLLRPTPEPARYEVDIRQLRGRLQTIAADPDTDLTLELSDVVADRQPDVFWEVYVGLPADTRPSPESPHFVGTLALFGHGIRDDRHRHGEFEPAAFSYEIDTALIAGLRRSRTLDRLTVTFVAKGAEGTELKTEANATVTIGSAAIAIRRLEPGREE